jgi:hypothetical protein
MLTLNETKVTVFHFLPITLLFILFNFEHNYLLSYAFFPYFLGLLDTDPSRHQKANNADRISHTSLDSMIL